MVNNRLLGMLVLKCLLQLTVEYTAQCMMEATPSGQMQTHHSCDLAEETEGCREEFPVVIDVMLY